MTSPPPPWRMKSPRAPKPPMTDVSLFTRIAQSGDDEANYVLARGRTCFALLNTYPYTGGHLMTVPYKQVPDFNDLTDQEIVELMLLTRRCQNALTKVMRPDGFNIGVNLGKAAGAGVVEHLHIHVVPPRNGGTNFMAVIANTTVVPQALKELAARLRDALAADSALRTPHSPL